MRTAITKSMLKDKITYANEMLDTTIINRDFNGYNHLMIEGDNIFAGSNRECVEFLNGLVQFQLLTKQYIMQSNAGNGGNNRRKPKAPAVMQPMTVTSPQETVYINILNLGGILL